ncbi:hypothetical protein CgunFtcFv8_018085 [Champsocephalus gunnari]|uniref:Uncharacterized protein n=1 Tax=Champsocephalus gunnari TaxID=52237 RepID=A0AAN8DLR9_CHAGU|nr:hypothetical protein CgunFtcFv8_018085 [Champsocephalus gunnari]
MLPNKNIIKVLNDIQLFGAPCSLTVVSSWDNTLEIQVPPELHFDMYHGTKKTSTVLLIAPDTEEDSGKEEEAHAQPANTRGGKTGESSMESLALRRGKRSV